MKSRDKFITKCIEQACNKLALDEQWDIRWSWDDKCPSSAAIDVLYTEKKANITIDPRFHKDSDEAILRRDIWHECAHILLYPIYRGVSDYADHLIKPKEKNLRAVYEEQFNTRENEVIDHIVTKVFKI